MKGQTNAKCSILTSDEVIYILIDGVLNPTIKVEYDGIENKYRGNYLEVKIPEGKNYTIVFEDIDGYIAPDSVSYTAVAYNARTLKVKYEADSVYDLSTHDIYGNRILLTTANCYVVNKPGKYRFPCVYGNMITNGEVNFEAATNNGGEYSHDFVNAYGDEIVALDISYDVSSCLHGNLSELSSVLLSIADTDNIFININLIDYSSNVANTSKAVEFEVLSVPETGANGVISVKDASGTICWSWHIWIWPYDLTPVEITNKTGVKYNILPVNLATILDTADSINKTTGWKNWFYQWGRPNPMLCPSVYNAQTNKQHASYGSLEYTTDTPATYLYEAILNPTTFFTHNGTENQNWFYNNGDKTYNLWDAECTTTGCSDNNVKKTVYDPCPAGFKIPNGNTFNYFLSANTVGDFVNGWKFKRYPNDTIGILFPITGYIDGMAGIINHLDSNGTWWLSARSSQEYAYHVLSSLDINYTSTIGNAYGCSVRPVEDDVLTVISPHNLTINVNGDTVVPSGYNVSIYQLLKSTDSETGETLVTLGELVGVQTNNSTTHSLMLGNEYRIIASDIDGFITPDPIDYVATGSEGTVLVSYTSDPIYDLSLHDVYGNRIKLSTANCYVVRLVGTYKFPLVYGNAIKNGQVNLEAFTNNGYAYNSDFYGVNDTVITTPYIEDACEPLYYKGSTDYPLLKGEVLNFDFLKNGRNQIIDNITIVEGKNCSYLLFNLNYVPSTGANYVLELRYLSDSYNTYDICWSWHIWIWPNDLTPIEVTNTYGTKYNIMPVNLASVKYSDDNIVSWYYQWGRKAPLLSLLSRTYDGDLFIKNIYGTISTDVYDGHMNAALNSYLLYEDWPSPSRRVRNLWDASVSEAGSSEHDTIKTVYDPCPVGWKVPNNYIFDGLRVLRLYSDDVSDTYCTIERYPGDTTGMNLPLLGCLTIDSVNAEDGDYIEGISECTLLTAFINGEDTTHTASYLYYRIYSRSQLLNSTSGYTNIYSAHNIRPVEDVL